MLIKARPVIIGDKSQIEVTNCCGRKRIIDCNWLSFCSGMIAVFSGLPIVRAFPTLVEADIQFMINGITDGEWEDIFGKCYQ